jgi:hypothetical protein
MSSFIVETSEELPQVLVFVANQSSRHKIEPLLREKGFTPEVFVLEGRKKGELQFETTFKRGEWYKIIVWLDQLFLPDRLEFLPALANFLSTRPEEKIWVGSMLTPLKVCDVFPAWVQASIYQQQAVSLISSVPRSTYFLGENVVPEPQQTSLEAQPLAYMQTSEADGSILAPRRELRFVFEESFEQEVKKHLFKPRHTSTLFQGKTAIRCSDLLREWGSVQLVDCSFAPHLFIEEKLIKQQLVDDQVENYLNAFVHQGGAYYAQSQATQNRNENGEIVYRSVQAVPLKVPLIENRQKKYEQRIQELQKQKIARKKLPSKTLGRYAVAQQPSKHQRQKQEKIDKRLEGEIFSLFGQQRAQQKAVRVTQKVQKTIHYTKKNDRQLKFSVVFAILMTILGFFASLAIVFILFQHLISASLIGFAQASTKGSIQEKQKSLKTLDRLNQAFGVQVDGYKFFLGKQAFPFSTQIAVIAQEVIDINKVKTEIGQESVVLVSQIFNKSQGDVFATFLTISTKAKDQYKKLSLLQNQLQTVESGELSDDQTRILKDYGNSMQEDRKNLATFQQLEQALPSILAQDKRKTYLILLQNTQELRPTGGYLQTIAFVTFENGVLINHQVLDVKVIDGALNGQIAPPQEIKEFLGQTKWLLRDANWSPDFATSGQQAMWFVEKGIGKKVDGVLAINTQVFEKLLHGLGPMQVSQYNEVITDKNVLEKMEFHSEISLGKPDSQEYSTVLFTTFLDQLSASDGNKMAAVANALYESLKSGEAFFYTNDESTNSVLKSLGWSGEVITPECPAQMSDGVCIVDSAMVVEANIGINKANYYVNRTSEDHVVIEDKSIVHTRKLHLTNTSPTNAWPAGPYKSYVRLYVPKSAQLGEVRIDDVVVDSKLVLVGSEKNKTYFGTRIEVPIQQTMTVTYVYSEPLDVSGSFAYTFFNQRQAGTGDSPLEITISAQGRRPVRIAPQAEVSANDVKFSLKQDKHSFVGVKYN